MGAGAGAPDIGLGVDPGVVGIGTSAGGLVALRAVLSRLPADLPVPIIVVQHLDPRHPSLLAALLARSSGLAVKEAEDGDELRPGVVYVGVPDHHLVVTTDHRVALTHTPQVSFTRPSVDVLFRSIADSYGAGAVAVVLTGTGHDGAAGVRAILDAGGTVIVEDPATAEFAGMPSAAVAASDGCLAARLDDIAQQLQHLLASREHG